MTALVQHASDKFPGLLVVVNHDTGETFASKGALAKLIGKDKIYVTRHENALLRTGSKVNLISAEILTGHGLRTGSLRDEAFISSLILKYRDDLVVGIMSYGIRAVLQQYVGFNINDQNGKEQKLLTAWRLERTQSIYAHKLFVLACKANKLPGCHAHNMMTTLCYGLTAEQSRKLPIVSDDLDITVGLNHQPSVEQIRRIAMMKCLFSGYRTGTWQERVVRAYNASNID